MFIYASNGTCTNVLAKGYTCTCAEGFTGDHCQIPASVLPFKLATNMPQVYADDAQTSFAAAVGRAATAASLLLLCAAL